MPQPRDSVYYMNNKRFLVEDTIFHVPIDSLAAQSRVFRLMTVPPIRLDGLTDETPIRLEGVLKDDFRQLMRVLYPQFQAPDFLLSFSQWTSVLKLAHKYEMDTVKEHAIASMEILPNADIDLVEKIVVARTYNIKSWIVPTLNAILQRPQSFTEHDLRRLGAPTLLGLVALRDRLRPLFDTGSSLQLGNRREPISVDFTNAIQETWPNIQGSAFVQYVPNEPPVESKFSFKSGLAPIKGLPDDPATGA